MTASFRSTTSNSTAGGGTITPARVLAVMAILLAVFIVFAPRVKTDAGAAYSSYATGAGGIRALYDVLSRMGYPVSRNDKPLTSRLDSAATYMVIQPAQPLTSIEQTRLIAAVRNGATVVISAGHDDLTDSLGFKLSRPPYGIFTLGRTVVVNGNPPAPTTTDPRDLLPAALPISATVASTQKSGNVVFLRINYKSDSSAITSLVIGHPVGRGYAIAFAPPEIVTNQLLRDPRAAIAMVRALEVAGTATDSPNRRHRIIFDEYHHGFGSHANMPDAVARALIQTPLGRVTIEIVIASLILLLAYGVRPLAPVPMPATSRRSPLEHVAALARAYRQVHAQHLGANRLVRGLRRRHSLGLLRSVPDSIYLSALKERLPAKSADIDRIIGALAPDSPQTSGHFATTGAAVANIERAFRK